MRVLKVTTVTIVILASSVFIAWMNITPGHFQVVHEWCQWEVEYMEDQYNPELVHGIAEPACIYNGAKRPIDILKLVVGYLDFKR